ncbi:MAG: L,D-transpeptidase [Deltaproteobacteria bacterium]|nr:L,D-transpeptidase [Deltaproteobacteria bacterium]
MRILFSALSVVLLIGLGCPASSTPSARYPTTQGTSQPTSQPQSGPTLTPQEEIPADRRVRAYLNGVSRVMDIDEARSYGFTIIDLGDDWVPYIFWSQTPGKEDRKPNETQKYYVDLANDRINLDGASLRRWERNYLEVYGIPPTLSVLQRRFVEDDKNPCFKKLDNEAFAEYHGPVRVVDPRGSERLRKRYYSARGNYKKALRRARVRTLEQLLQRPASAKVARTYQRLKWQISAVAAMQKRLACEGMYGRRRPRVKPGIINWAVRVALKRFERKHNVYGWGMIFGNTAKALGNTPRQNNFESLKRVIAERVVGATGILENGSRKSRYTTADGGRAQVRDLVSEFGAAALQQMGLTDADKAYAWIMARTKAELAHQWVAVKLPKLPEYYNDQMDLSVVIDRGDVWYDLPFNEKTGKRKGQPRSRLPSFTLYTTYRDQKIPLVRWRTTIGGWQKEKRGEQEYYKYKISDVGKRVWRNIVAGPVWVPPKATPTTDLVKFRSVLGKSQRVVSQSTFGPGYASAYGLVAAYHVTKGGRDNQVRTHGTVNYMSVRAGFSHGCHRLYNYRAVRLFSFVLRHREFDRRGQTRLAYRHRFEHRGEEFQINLHTRGYYYELKPPLPVEVLEGRIRGKAKKPFPNYVKKPSVLYQEDLPKLQQRGKKNSMSQQQSL